MVPRALNWLRRNHTRLSASVLASALVCAQLSSAMHFAFVKHVSCAEHGELVEVGPNTAAPRAVVTPNKAVHSDESVQHGHDHCTITALRRERFLPASPITITTRIPSVLLAYAPTALRAPPPAIALLDLAPKSSPPSV